MKILIADADPISRRVLQANLIKWGYEVMVASDGRDALETIRQPEPPNLLISDWIMPHMDGLVLCQEVRALAIKRYIYVILLTAKGEKKDILKGLEAGADDFLTKPLNHDELKYRVCTGERIIKLEQRIREMEDTDPLTGIMNRRAFMERMEQETSRAHRDQTPLAFIISDIDHFKTVNDTFGHQAGDLVLQWFAHTLKKAIRPYDVLGRYGDEEFVVCMPGTDASQAEVTADRFRQAVAEMEIILPGQADLLSVTASFGTASCMLESREKVASLIKRAEEGLRQAKAESANDPGA